MSDTNNPGDKTAERGPRKPLSLKRPIEQGVVRQSFSHGRTKQVIVETVKRASEPRLRRPVTPRPPQGRRAAPAPRPVEPRRTPRPSARRSVRLLVASFCAR